MDTVPGVLSVTQKLVVPHALFTDREVLAGSDDALVDWTRMMSSAQTCNRITPDVRVKDTPVAFTATDWLDGAVPPAQTPLSDPESGPASTIPSVPSTEPSKGAPPEDAPALGPDPPLPHAPKIASKPTYRRHGALARTKHVQRDVRIP